MTVKELIEELGKFPEDMKVILSKDPEGNGFSESADCWDYYYDGEDIISEEDIIDQYDDTYYGEVIPEEKIEEILEQAKKDYEKVVVIWP